MEEQFNSPSLVLLSMRNKPKEFSNGCGAISFLTSKKPKNEVFCPVSCTLIIKKGLCTTCCIYTPVLWKSVFLKCCASVSNFTFHLRDPLVP